MASKSRGGSGEEGSSILIDYFKYTKIYQSKYGENTVVFMQVGAFFEVYSIKHPKTGFYEITKILEFTETCNLNIAEKKISIGNGPIENPYQSFPEITDKTPEVTITKQITQWLRSIPECKVVMAGVRDYQIEKYIQKMTDAGFTVVVYTQEKDSRNIITRKIQNIYSPGTFLGIDEENSSTNSKLSNHIMSIWMESNERRLGSTEKMLVCGISCINIFTGETHLFEYENSYMMNPTTFDELERIVSTFYPKELIIIGEGVGLDQESVQTILKYIGIPSNTAIHTFFLGTTENQAVKNCIKQTYMKQILSTIYGNPDIFDTCMEFQSNVIATQSFCYLLHFIQEHNQELIKRIHMPVFSNVSNRMILANHTLRQLNILNDGSLDGKSAGHYSSVAVFLNKCCTAMGKRKFHYQITHPTFDIEWLNQEYETIDQILQKYPIEKLREIRQHMKCGMKDLERLGRQIIAGRIYPSGIVHLYETMKCLQYIRENYMISMPMDQEVNMADFLVFLETRFYLERCVGLQSMTTFEHNIIKKGVSTELDKCIDRRIIIESLIKDIRQGLIQSILKEDSASGSTKNQEDFIKIHETEKNGISFQITKKRSKIVQDLVKKREEDIIVSLLDGTETVDIKWCDLRVESASTNYDEIRFPYLTRQTRDLNHIEDELNNLISDTYRKILTEIATSWYDLIEQIGIYISQIDVTFCKSYMAIENRYCRPIIQTYKEKAYVHAEGLRHCLIEHLQQNELYVTNDVYLGKDEQDGILLYGTNAVGKTSIIKALGISIIMAQAGCYVPCSRFKYWPYKAIFSRILGNDNIFKGLSTFAVEMSELRMILKTATKDSLILGDELCSGTETDSALAIFTAGLIKLSAIESSFIFATHFHEILKFQEMQELTKIAVKHMSVVYDYEKECLIYDRKIKDGPGNRMYGLEVCKSLYLPQDFLELANKIRLNHSEIKSELSSPKSTYNSQKIRGICEMCGEKMGEEIHHLQWQQDADEKGFIGHFHKNHKANLASVCEGCHEKIHHIESTKMIEETTKIEKGNRLVRKKTTRGYIISSKE